MKMTYRILCTPKSQLEEKENRRILEGRSVQALNFL